MEEKRILDLFNKEMKFNFIRLKGFLYKPVIYVPNDLTNPTIGIAVDIIEETEVGQPCLVIHDFVDNQTKRFTGVPFEYHEKTLRAIMRLNAYERLMVFYKANPDLISYRRLEEKILTYEEIIAKLEEYGYDKAIKEYSWKEQLY